MGSFGGKEWRAESVESIFWSQKVKKKKNTNTLFDVSVIINCMNKY